MRAGKVSSNRACTTNGGGLGVNESVMWGDYFFLEAVCKVLGAE